MEAEWISDRQPRWIARLERELPNLREALDYCLAEDTEQVAAAGLRTIGALDIARQFGATDVIDASQDDPVQAVFDLTGGGVDYAFEVVGLSSTTQQAYAMLGPAAVRVLPLRSYPASPRRMRYCPQ
ncbi:zinc-binding dehydrogenase [Nocardia fusca]|uniref:zinc-binding dehydrogenase n=1 Tax=Nocardia fusca TaxID=941183 RepID=UPI0007A75ED8